MNSKKATDALVGVAVGDALGVPFEFKSSTEMKLNPARGMIGNGTHNQLPGTWSDDTSLTLCLAESLLNGFDLVDISKRIIAWKDEGYWTARNEIFDIGRTTSRAIEEMREILLDEDYDELKNLKLYPDEKKNGNGSLMRILPLLFYIKDFDSQKQFEIIEEVSCLTHPHIRASIACFIYLKFAQLLLEGMSKEEAYEKTRNETLKLWDEINLNSDERNHFIRLIQNDILTTKRENLKSGGYVIEAIEAALWCFLKEESYESSVLSVINLGHDTDTTAAITGGLAGIYYGIKGIPAHWVASLARMEDIIQLGEDLNNKYYP